MRRQHRLSITLLVSFCLLFITMPAAAQDANPPAPQFLYRDENHLVLLDGYTGEATQLPFEVTKSDQFSWSPDGKYLLSRLHDGENNGYCLNLYDVDAQKWLYAKPISCAVGEAIFSSDGSQIIYVSEASDENNAVLWSYSLADKKGQELYRSTEGNNISPDSISSLRWSPTETYLTFEPYHQILGGTINFFEVMNSKSHEHFTVYGEYYASYSPIWSKDDSWFLIILKEQYVTSGALPTTNHRGDVYLVNSETGAKYRITYTPADFEGNLHWTNDGQIAFSVTTVTVQDFTYTPEQAMQVEVVPKDQIVQPGPVDSENYYPDPFKDVMIAPDPNIGAWVSSMYQEDGKPTIWVLNIGSTLAESPISNFYVQVPEDTQYNRSILIGWRPSDYPYSLG
jgi:Tol biopolymer transport system component